MSCPQCPEQKVVNPGLRWVCALQSGDQERQGARSSGSLSPLPLISLGLLGEETGFLAPSHPSMLFLSEINSTSPALDIRAAPMRSFFRVKSGQRRFWALFGDRTWLSSLSWKCSHVGVASSNANRVTSAILLTALLGRPLKSFFREETETEQLN